MRFPKVRQFMDSNRIQIDRKHPHKSGSCPSEKRIEGTHHMPAAARIGACALAAVVAVGGIGGYYVYATDVQNASKEQTADLNDAKEELLKHVLNEQTNREDVSVDKEETVYVVADASGAPQDVIVSDWLKNKDSAAILKDVSTLSDIENVKGDEIFTSGANGAITWQADGNDIYYQGKTQKELPVDIKMTYYLDGKEISPKELAGKSGSVKIRIDYTNKEKSGDVYVPFAAVSGILLNDDFTNIEVKNGKVISDGSRNIVVGYAFPGLAESLKLETRDLDALEIPDYVELTAEVTDFSLDMTLTFLMSDILSELDMNRDIDLTSVDDAMNDLNDAAKQLMDGSRELVDGVESLGNGISDYTDGVSALKDGVQTYTNGYAALLDGVLKYTSGVSTLRSGLSEYTSGVTSLRDGVYSYTDGMANLDEGIHSYTAGVSQVKSGVDAYTDGVAQVAAGTKQLADQSGKLASGVSQLTDGALTVQGYFEGEDGLVSGAGKLAAGINQLDAALNAGVTDAEKQQAQAQINEQFAADGAVYQGISAQAASQYQSALTGNSELQTKVEGGITQAMSAAYAAAYIQINSQAYNDQGISDQLESDAANFAAQMTQASEGQISGVSAQMIREIADGTAPQIGTMTAEAAKQGAAAGAESAIDSTKSAIASQIEEGGLVEGANALSDGVSKLYNDGINPLSEGMSELNSNVPILVDGVDHLNSGAAELNQNSTTLKQGVDTLNQKGSELASGADTLNASSDKLTSGADALSEGGSKLNEGADTLHSNGTKLNAGANTFANAGSKLNAGVGTLSDNSSKLRDGSDQLLEGASKLSDGMVKFDEEGIQKLTDTYHGDIKDLLDRFDRVKEAGKNYHSFSGLSDDMTGNVKFIIRTEGIMQ